MHDRAVTSTVGTVLLVAVVVVVAAVVGGVAFGVVEELNEPTPPAAESAGEFTTGSPGSCGTYAIELTHEGGDTVDLARVYVQVRLPDNGGQTARLVNLPADGGTLEGENLDDPNDLVTDYCIAGVIEDGDGSWGAGDRVKFELNSGSGVATGDRIEVLIVHEPSGGVIVEKTFVAE